MKTIIALSSAIALSLAANITIAQPGGWGQGAGNGDRAQMRQERIQARVEALLERFDANQDGQITLDEVQNKRAEHFAQMDADGNGLVSAEELESFKAKMREQYQNDAAQNRGKGQRGGKRGCDGRGKGNRLQRLDNDGDGQISYSEFTANVPLFDRFDADENGILTQEELSQIRGRGRR